MLDLTALLVFAGALLVAAASPGPGIAAIVARVLARGPSGAIAFAAGVALGDVVWLSFAVAGLAVLAQAFYGVFLGIKLAGAAYLLYLAWKLWTAPAAAATAAVEAGGEGRLKLFLGGLAVTLGNPKVMVFYLALLPNLVDLGRVTLLGYAELALATQVVLALVFGIYIVLAGRARRLLSSPSAMRLVNRGSGAVMAGAAVAVATR
jgi:threonine/homoserine/homoserine lactone efflux protein